MTRHAWHDMTRPQPVRAVTAHNDPALPVPVIYSDHPHSTYPRPMSMSPCPHVPPRGGHPFSSEKPSGDAHSQYTGGNGACTRFTCRPSFRRPTPSSYPSPRPIRASSLGRASKQRLPRTLLDSTSTHPHVHHPTHSLLTPESLSIWIRALPHSTSCSSPPLSERAVAPLPAIPSRPTQKLGER